MNHLSNAFDILDMMGSDATREDYEWLRDELDRMLSDPEFKKPDGWESKAIDALRQDLRHIAGALVLETIRQGRCEEYNAWMEKVNRGCSDAHLQPCPRGWRTTLVVHVDHAVDRPEQVEAAARNIHDQVTWHLARYQRSLRRFDNDLTVDLDESVMLAALPRRSLPPSSRDEG